MTKTPKSSLQITFASFFILKLILVIVIAILSISIYLGQNRLSTSRDQQFQSYLLADELRQSSDDLTRLARAYVATGNPEFEQEYWTVLDIRNGAVPRPEKYNHIYWDFVAATGEKPRLDGSAVSLQDLMIREGFTEEEFAKLREAQQNSDQLVLTEQIAMNAAKGLYADDQGNFTIEGEPDLELANGLMNNNEYYQVKAKIMKPIDDFYNLFEARTQASVTKNLNNSKKLLQALLIFASFLTVAFIITNTVLNKQIRAKEIAEQELTELSTNLEKQVKERTIFLEKAQNETREALKKSDHLNKFMVGRELKMIELKKKIKALNNRQS